MVDHVKAFSFIGELKIIVTSRVENSVVGDLGRFDKVQGHIGGWHLFSIGLSFHDVFCKRPNRAYNNSKHERFT
jgi:hypothetical protein